MQHCSACFLPPKNHRVADFELNMPSTQATNRFCPRSRHHRELLPLSSSPNRESNKTCAQCSVAPFPARRGSMVFPPGISEIIAPCFKPPYVRRVTCGVYTCGSGLDSSGDKPDGTPRGGRNSSDRCSEPPGRTSDSFGTALVVPDAAHVRFRGRDSRRATQRRIRHMPHSTATERSIYYENSFPPSDRSGLRFPCVLSLISLHKPRSTKP